MGGGAGYGGVQTPLPQQAPQPPAGAAMHGMPPNLSSAQSVSGAGGMNPAMMMMLLNRIFGDQNTTSATMNSIIPPMMPGSPGQNRGSAPRAPWSSGQTFSGLNPGQASMLG